MNREGLRDKRRIVMDLGVAYGLESCSSRRKSFVCIGILDDNRKAKNLLHFVDRILDSEIQRYDFGTNLPPDPAAL